MIKRLSIIIITVFLSVLFLAGCGSSGISGSWAYNYEPEEPVLVIKSGGCSYKGKECSCSDDGNFIHLGFKDGSSLDLRYRQEGDKLFLYEKTVYELEGGAQPSGLAGNWVCPEKKWSFAFLADGSFVEDGVFTGRYSEDKAGQTFTLDYMDEFENTTCYYSIEGHSLTVEYPWQMVKVK